MAKDDRFTLIAGTLAVLITAGLFLWSHWGSLAVSARSYPQAESIEVVSNYEELMPAREDSNNQEEPQIVAARYEVESVELASAATASNKDNGSEETSLVILEEVANQWSGAQVPAAAEVMVWQDRDGRMIVTNGTHRRYRALRKDLENLDIQSVQRVLQHNDLDDSLKANLKEALDTALAIEVPDVEPDMVAGAHAWQFADAEYQSLSQGQKHLLLMGRANATAVRAKLAEVRQLLGEPEIGDVGQPTAPPDPVVIAEASQGLTPLEIPIEP